MKAIVCKISVIIPTFKRPGLLYRCLSALQNQSFPQAFYKVIVISDGPDEISKAILNDFKPGKFSFYEMPEKKGPAAARNFGWKKAKGMLVAFTDDDTIPDRDWLSNFWKAYQTSNGEVYTGKTIVPLQHFPTDYEKNIAALETAEFITANCCCTKAILEKVKGFDERFNIAWREDSDLHFKFIKEKIPIAQIHDAIVVHPVRSAPWGVSIREQKKGIFNVLLYKKYPLFYRQRIQPFPAWNYYAMIISLTASLYFFIIQSFYMASVLFLLWALLLFHFAFKRLKHTSKSISHVTEMLFTSACIPFVSLYWHWYGNFKYRTLVL